MAKRSLVKALKRRLRKFLKGFKKKKKKEAPKEVVTDQPKKKTNKEKRLECIKKTVEATGWTEEYAAEQIKKTKEITGVTYKKYIKLMLYEVDLDVMLPEYKARDQKRKKEIEERKRIINEICEASGWSVEKTKAQLKYANKKLNINEKQFLRFKLYEVEQNLYKQTVRKKKAEASNRFVELVCVKSGWDFDHAKEEMLKTKRAYGYTFKQYYKNNLFESPFEEQQERFKQEVADRRERIRANRENYLSKIIEKTGWERKYAIAVVHEASERTGCTYEEFFLYKFYELNEEEQADVFLQKESKKITKKYNVNREFVNILYDKELSNVYFDKYLGRAWCVNTKISEDEFVERFTGIKKVFYKPLKGHHGDGARPFEITDENIRDVYKELSTLSIGVVEEYIVQHPELSRMAPSAVNTMRVVTISSNEKPILEGGENIEVVYASLKMGGKNSIVDNLVGGGIVANVDLQTGRLITDAADDQGGVYSVHPATGVTIKGFQIPFFNEALQLVKDVYADKKMEGYLGWDIAFTEKGPVIIEINTVPGVILFQLPHMIEKHGMKPYMKKYYED